jgi:hypothetical protein
VALLMALLLALAAFAAWQFGVPAFQRSQPVPAYSPSEDLALPSQVYDPEPYVASTESVGPPGPVGLVFRGRTARDGLTGVVDDPWYAVSSRDGAYYRLEEAHLAQARSGVYVGPQGTRLAWAWPGGIARYDTVTGETQEYAVDGDATTGALAWSPDSTHIAFGADPVRVLDVGTGKITALPLRLPSGVATTPAWTPDGQWVTAVVDDALHAVQVDTGRRRTVSLRDHGGTPVVGAGGFTGTEWNTAGDLAGVHRQVRLSRNVLRIVRTPSLTRDAAVGRVVDASPPRMSIEGFLGWGSTDHAVLTGLRAASGPVDQALVLSVPDNTLSPYMVFPALGENWAGVSSVSVATDLLGEPTSDFTRPTRPWSPVAKLLLCLLLVLFPTVYYLTARRPRP